MQTAPCPIPGRDVNHVPVCWVVDAHPGTRASRPHHFPGTALADSAAGMERQRGRASLWALQTAPCPIPGRDVNHVPAFLCGGCPPGTAGVPPAHFPGTALADSAAGMERLRGRGSLCILQTAPCPIPGRDVNHVPGLLGGGCPPGNAGVPPAHLPGTALADSAAGMERQRGLAFHSDWPLPFTPAGGLPAGNVALTPRDLQPGIRLRARRPRSRGGAVGLLASCRWGSRRRQAACLQLCADGS